MILVDYQINALCEGKVPEDIQSFYSHALKWEDCPAKVLPLVEPFDHELINPASLDIRIGNNAKFRTHTLNRRAGRSEPTHETILLNDFDETEPYWMNPGDRLLVASLETINLPNFICAQFRLKSSRGREWYEHMEAGYCDCGWHGSKLTMEIINMDLAPLPIYPGLKMGQLVFSPTFGLPRRSYAVTGRYNGDRHVAQSKG